MLGKSCLVIALWIVVQTLHANAFELKTYLFKSNRKTNKAEKLAVKNTETVKHSQDNRHWISRVKTLFRSQESILSATASQAGSESFEPGKPPQIIIFGAPASGKGTQCEILKKELALVHLSTGDMLRDAVKKGTEIGNLAKSYMAAGKLVPDEVVIGIVKERLAQDDCVRRGWLLDGFPRTKPQAEALANAGIHPDRFILLNVPDETLIERVVGRRSDPVTGAIYHLKFAPPPNDSNVLGRLVQREDDTEEKARFRLSQYYANVQAVIGCYKNIVVQVDGTQAKEQFFSVIKDSLKPKISQS